MLVMTAVWRKKKTKNNNHHLSLSLVHWTKVLVCRYLNWLKIILAFANDIYPFPDPIPISLPKIHSFPSLHQEDFFDHLQMTYNPFLYILITFKSLNYYNIVLQWSISPLETGNFLRGQIYVTFTMISSAYKMESGSYRYSADEWMNERTNLG